MALESKKDQPLRMKRNEQFLELAYCRITPLADNELSTHRKELPAHRDFCDFTTDSRTLLNMYDKKYNQAAERDSSTSAGLAVPRLHHNEPTTGSSLVLYNEVPQYSGAVPSYCEMQLDGEVHISVATPLALRPCTSSVSMVSYAASESNSSSLGPTCRICDSSSEGCNRLISPCRCSGTSKFVHEQCLNKWLETINAHHAPRCEVCRYHIRTHKVYRLRNWKMPEVSNCDLALHLIFVAAIGVLIISAAFTMVGFVSNHSKMAARRAGDVLSPEETVVLIGGLTFFVAFIVALLTQIRASQTVYQLLVACVSVNTEWRIDQYHRSEDSLYCK